MKKGLVLEGGAMRGLFTAGVTDVMLEENIVFDGMIGVSAGAAFGCNLERFTNRGIQAIDILGRAIGFKDQGELAVLVADQAKVCVGATNIARQNKAIKLCIGIKPFDFHKKLQIL
jgi:hypothetical protein